MTQRFSLVLNKVVDDEDFDPENLRNYFREKLGEKAWPQFERAVEMYVLDAWAVKEFLGATGRKATDATPSTFW